MDTDTDTDAGRHTAAGRDAVAGRDMVTVATAVRDACPGFWVQFMHFLAGNIICELSWSGAPSRTDNQFAKRIFHSARDSGIYAECFSVCLARLPAYVNFDEVKSIKGKWKYEKYERSGAAAAAGRTIKTLLITNLPKNQQLNTISATMAGNRFRQVPQSGNPSPPARYSYTSTPKEVRNKLAFSITSAGRRGLTRVEFWAVLSLLPGIKGYREREREDAVCWQCENAKSKSTWALNELRKALSLTPFGCSSYSNLL